MLVVQSAQHAGLVLSAHANIRLGDDADARFTFEVTGEKGSREFSFASGAALTDIRDAINNFSSVTGVSAAVSAATELVLKSTTFGSAQFVSVKVTGGEGDIEGSGIYGLSTTDENVLDTGSQTTFANATTAVRDSGR